MRKIYYKLKFYVITAWHSFFRSMAAADAVMLEQGGENEDAGTHQLKTQGTLWNKLLGGVVDEEVEEMRARSYKVLRSSEGVVADVVYRPETDEYVVRGTHKKSMITRPPENIEISDNEELILVYDIKPTRLATNHISDDVEYNLHIEREITPRFRIEKYTTKIVLKKIDDQHTKIEFYCKYYADQFSKISALYISTMNKLYKEDKNPGKSDIFDFNGINFKTDAGTFSFGYGSGYEFRYIKPVFQDIHIYDGHYIVSFIMENDVVGNDLFKKYMKDEVEKEYEEQTPYGTTISPFAKDIDYETMSKNKTELVDLTH